MQSWLARSSALVHIRDFGYHDEINTHACGMRVLRALRRARFLSSSSHISTFLHPREHKWPWRRHPIQQRTSASSKTATLTHRHEDSSSMIVTREISTPSWTRWRQDCVHGLVLSVTSTHRITERRSVNWNSCDLVLTTWLAGRRDFGRLRLLELVESWRRWGACSCVWTGCDRLGFVCETVWVVCGRSSLAAPDIFAHPVGLKHT